MGEQNNSETILIADMLFIHNNLAFRLFSLASKQFIAKFKIKTYPHFIAPAKNKHQKGFKINFKSAKFDDKVLQKKC